MTIDKPLAVPASRSRQTAPLFPRGSGGVRRLSAGVFAVALLGFAGTAAAATTAPGATPRSTDVPTARLTLPAPTQTIHWAVRRDGSVELGDRPASGPVASRGTQTFAGLSPQQAQAQAAREREYWRTQADAFDSRQRERARQLEAQQEARLARLERQQAMAPSYFAVPTFFRGGGVFGQPGWGGGWVPPGAAQLGATPQAAALGGGPSPFLSSGFARGR